MVRHVFIILLVLSPAACGGGGGSSSPTTPTPVTPAATTASVAIAASTDMIAIQGTTIFIANATMSDGSSKPGVSATWTSDAASVATVDSSGKVTGVGSGQATITAAYDTVRATRTIRVVPDYQGSWTGDYTVLSCSDSGTFRSEDWCKAALADGIIHVTMALTQTRDAVTGSWTHKQMAGTTSGTIESDGTLVLSGNGKMDTIPMTITGWRTRSTDNRTQTGKFTLNFTSSVWSGSSQAGVEIRTCTKG
jgi:hypothetical protein